MHVNHIPNVMPVFFTTCVKYTVSTSMMPGIALSHELLPSSNQLKRVRDALYTISGTTDMQYYMYVLLFLYNHSRYNYIVDKI